MKAVCSVGIGGSVVEGRHPTGEVGGGSVPPMAELGPGVLTSVLHPRQKRAACAIVCYVSLNRESLRGMTVS